MNESALAVKGMAAAVSLETEFSAFGSITHFENAQRMATALASSTIVPETYRGKEHLGDCLIALEIANRIGASVLAVMQNLYIVYGRPAWSSQFLISCVNASRKFTPLRYKMTGIKGEDSWGCIAWAEDRAGEKLESPEVTVSMAKAEGWFQKNGSKWKTMPELMLRYRAATLFARLYAPELTMGIQTDEEVIDISPVITDPVAKAKKIKSQGEADGPKFGTSAAAETPEVLTENPAGGTAKTETAQPTPPAASATTQPELSPGSPQGKLQEFYEPQGVTFDKFRAWVAQTDRLENADSYATWAELPVAFCEALVKDSKALARSVVRCKT